jgi:hypothetical protein
MNAGTPRDRAHPIVGPLIEWIMGQDTTSEAVTGAATVAILVFRHCPVDGVGFLHRRTRFRFAASHQYFMKSLHGLLEPGSVTVKVM